MIDERSIEVMMVEKPISLDTQPIREKEQEQEQTCKRELIS